MKHKASQPPQQKLLRILVMKARLHQTVGTERDEKLLNRA